MSDAELGRLVGGLLIAGLPAYILIRLAATRKRQAWRYLFAALAVLWAWAVALPSGSMGILAFAVFVTAWAVRFSAPASPEA